MTWTIELSRTAGRSLERMQQKERHQVATAIEQMKTDPFVGNVIALRGQHEGTFRRRVGAWRLLFETDVETQTVHILAILRRTSTTYR